MWINIDEEQVKARGLAYVQERIEYSRELEGGEYLKAAQENYGRDGELEFDDDTVVSISEGGAYVMGWQWIADEEVGLEECKHCYGTGSAPVIMDGGFSGAVTCPACDGTGAVKVEEEEQ